jgi:hypothetical protein
MLNLVGIHGTRNSLREGDEWSSAPMGLPPLVC